jgi:hypothetical protein
MRSPLVVIGALIAILGYAIVYNGLSNIIHTGYFPKGPVGIADGLFPHLTTGTTAKITPATSTSTAATPKKRPKSKVGAKG